MLNPKINIISMDYVELNIPVQSNEQGEIITACLSDFPFESFLSEKNRLKAYIPQEQLAECMEEVNEMLASFKIEGFRYISIETQNWNAQWESNFQQVEVADNKLLIRAPFHPRDDRFEMEVVIMPKMSFGTGHHQTTHLMSEAITDLSLQGLRGLDMGCGTGLLAIVAVKCGAEAVDAIDIDDWAWENCRENIAENGVESKIMPLLGNAALLEGRSYDFILANINRNILVADMPAYVRAMRRGATLLMSGFLEEDITIIESKAQSLGLSQERTLTREGWVVLQFKK
ncbi:MAG: 50S ribosomal protein L11 methyltransferase [Rikenellaceae bacterium]